MENKDAPGLSTNLEINGATPAPGSMGSDQELQRLQQDVEKVKAARRQQAKQKEHPETEEAAGSGREAVDEQDRLFHPDGNEQTIGEFALQVETFMKEAEAAAIERPALALLAAFSLGIIVGQMFFRR